MKLIERDAFHLCGYAVETDAAHNTDDLSAVLKTIPKTTYAVAHYPHMKDAIEAWGEFFFTDIPHEGYAPNEQLNLYFEYFPKDVNGDYELWVPVEKIT